MELYHLSKLLELLNDRIMADTEFFDNFLCRCKRISFDDALNWILSASNGRTLCSSSSRLLPPLQNFLNHHCTVYSLAVPRPNALLMFQVVFAAL